MALSLSKEILEVTGETLSVSSLFSHKDPDQPHFWFDIKLWSDKSKTALLSSSIMFGEGIIDRDLSTNNDIFNSCLSGIEFVYANITYANHLRRNPKSRKTIAGSNLWNKLRSSWHPSTDRVLDILLTECDIYLSLLPTPDWMKFAESLQIPLTTRKEILKCQADFLKLTECVDVFNSILGDKLHFFAKIACDC